jgi:hypothetical protein
MHNSFSNLSVNDDVDTSEQSPPPVVPEPEPVQTTPDAEPKSPPNTKFVTINVNNSNNPKVRVRVVGSNINKVNSEGVEVMSDSEQLQVQYYCYGWYDLNSPLVGPFLDGKTYNIPKIPELNYAQTALDVVLKAPAIPYDVIYKFAENGTIEWETYDQVHKRVIWSYYKDATTNVRLKILQWVKAAKVEPDDFKAAFNDLCQVPEMKRNVLASIIETDGDWNRYVANKKFIVPYYAKTTPVIQKKLLPWINNWLGKK